MMRARMTAIAVCAVALLPAGLAAQQTSPDLELEEYRIVGQDTRVFTITGEPLTVVSFVPTVLELPDEQRAIGSSAGLIGDSERTRRNEPFLLTRGPNAELDYTFGAFKTNDLYARLGYGAGAAGGAIRFSHRSAEAHTPANLAPLARDVEVMGYTDTFFGEVTASAGFTAQKDDTPSAGFRPGSRELSRFRTTFALVSDQFDTWAVSGNARLVSGTYTDLVTVNENDELFIGGEGEATGRLWGTDIRLTAMTDFYELGGDNGSSVTAGGTGTWLFADRLGITLGALFATSAMPGDDTEANLYPQAAVDFLAAPWLYARASYRPRLVTHTFGGLYDTNGLVTLTAPLLYEDRKVDVSGEVGLRLGNGFTFAVSGGREKGGNAPVFSRMTTTAGDEFYDIVSGAEVTTKTVRVAASYDHGIWSVNGEIASRSASWNFSGDVPYIPEVEASIGADWTVLDVWNLRGAARLFGKHHVEMNSGDTEDSFLVVDVGVDRPVWRDNVSAFLDLRNLTDADGSWWSGQHRTPGIGLYTGLSARY